MAAVAGSRSAHATLSGTTADTVTLEDVQEYIEVVNHDATTVIYFTYIWDPQSVNTVTTAVAAADETTAVAVNSSHVFPARGHRIEMSVVGNNNVYSVQSF